MREQVADGDRQVVVRVHQPRGGRHDAVAVRVGIVGERDAEAILQLDQARHRVRARAVHADLAVVIHGHERERRIDRGIDDGDVEPVDGVDRLPVRLRRTAERIDAQREARGADRVHVDDVSQILDVRQDEVLFVRRRRLDAPRERHPLHAGDASARAARWRGPAPTRVTSVSAGPPLGGLYLKPPSSGGLCEGVITMPSARCAVRPRLWVRIAREMTGVGVTPSSRWMIGFDAVGRQHFEGGALRRLGQRVRVLAHVERAVDASARAGTRRSPA